LSAFLKSSTITESVIKACGISERFKFIAVDAEGTWKTEVLEDLNQQAQKSVEQDEGRGSKKKRKVPYANSDAWFESMTNRGIRRRLWQRLWRWQQQQQQQPHCVRFGRNGEFAAGAMINTWSSKRRQMILLCMAAPFAMHHDLFREMDFFFDAVDAVAMVPQLAV
jgi:hypothetical protein